MHLRCLQENLSRGLGIVQPAVATRTTLPITQHVLLQTDEGRLKLSATDLNIAINTWVGGDIIDEGAITIPARILTEFVNSLEPHQVIEVKPLEQGHGLALAGDRNKTNIKGADADEFPPIPKIDEGIATRMAGRALRESIHQVVLAAANEDSRPVLTGVNVELEGDKVTFAAADGFRLAVRSAELLEPVPEKTSVIIPSRTLSDIERLVEGDEPVDIVVTPTKGQAMFRFRNIEVVSQLLQGTFPNYAQLIPQEHTTQVVINLGSMKRETRTASIFAKDGSGIIRLEMMPDAGRMKISARAEEVGDSEGHVEAKIEGSEGRIAFSSRYLTDVLNVVKDVREGKEEVALQMTTSSSPGVIRPVEEGGDILSVDEVGSYVHVVMPMFVQW